MSPFQSVRVFYWKIEWSHNKLLLLQSNMQKSVSIYLLVCNCLIWMLVCTCMECPVGLRGNLKVSLKEGSLSCRHTLVFFLMILFWVATFTTYNLTYRSEGILNKRWIWISEPASYLKVNKITRPYARAQACTQAHSKSRPGRWSGLLNL